MDVHEARTDLPTFKETGCDPRRPVVLFVTYPGSQAAGDLRRNGSRQRDSRAVPLSPQEQSADEHWAKGRRLKALRKN